MNADSVQQNVAAHQLAREAMDLCLDLAKENQLDAERFRHYFKSIAKEIAELINEPLEETGPNVLAQPYDATNIVQDKTAYEEVSEALTLVQKIEDTIDGLPDRVQDRGADFFESVREKAGSIAETIEERGEVTEAQQAALENMLEGVRKWVR